MSIEIKCDFCNKLIQKVDGKNIIVATDSVDVLEYICDDCKTTDLQQTWDDEQNNLEDGWVKIENEKKNFLKCLLKKQKKTWLKEKEKSHFGSFYKET